MPAAYNSKIYFGCNNSSIYCVDALSSPMQLVSAQNLGSAVISSPAISSTGGLVFVASSVVSQDTATLYALDSNDITNQRWSVQRLLGLPWGMHQIFPGDNKWPDVRRCRRL